MPSREECRVWWKLADHEPSEAQWPIHESPARVKMFSGGERAGKSCTAGMFVLPRLPDTRLIWIVARDYNLARPEFEYIYNALAPHGFVKSVSMPSGQSARWWMRLATDTEVFTVTAADEVKLAARAPDGIIMAEAAQQSYDIYLRLRRRLAERRGWLLMEGTFESSEDWYADLWETWRNGGPEGEQSFSLPSWSNLAVFPGGYDDPEIQLQLRVLGEALFQERFGGIPSTPSTVVFPEFSYARHVGLAAFDPEKPVEVCVDPGYNGAYAVLAVQYYGGVVRVIDEIYVQRQGVREVIKEARDRPWARQVRPWAAGVIDIAGTQHQGMQSHAELWALPRRKGGAGWTLQSQFVPVEDGIERLRSFLIDPSTGEPRLLYNSEDTKSSQLEYKRYKYPTAKDGRPQREKPVDRDNHAIKALTYWLATRFGLTPARKRRSYDLSISPGHTRTSGGAYGSPDKRGRHSSRLGTPLRIR